MSKDVEIQRFNVHTKAADLCTVHPLNKHGKIPTELVIDSVGINVCYSALLEAGMPKIAPGETIRGVILFRMAPTLPTPEDK